MIRYPFLNILVEDLPPMHDWFSEIDARCELAAGPLEELREVGFAVIPGPVAADRWPLFVQTHDAAVAGALAADVHIGSSTTRVNDFVNRGPEFDALYVHEPILKACCAIIGQPFKLSTMHARSVRPYSAAQNLHVDFRRTGDFWPMVGFILMVDEFRSENGATRFVPGSHHWPATPESLSADTAEEYDGQALACGPAGSVIVYNGSVWHGHKANQTAEPRRSIQGAFIHREAAAAVNHAACLKPETRGRIGQLAKYLLDV